MEELKQEIERLRDQLKVTQAEYKDLLEWFYKELDLPVEKCTVVGIKTEIAKFKTVEGQFDKYKRQAEKELEKKNKEIIRLKRDVDVARQLANKILNQCDDLDERISEAEADKEHLEEKIEMAETITGDDINSVF